MTEKRRESVRDKAGDEVTPGSPEGVEVSVLDSQSPDSLAHRPGAPLDPCTCGIVRLNGRPLLDAPRNWNPDCPEHGVESEWWGSPEQVAKRHAATERLRALQQQAREARKGRP